MSFLQPQPALKQQRQLDNNAVFGRMQSILDSLRGAAGPNASAHDIYLLFAKRSEDRFSAFFRSILPPEEGIAFERMHDLLLGRLMEEHAASSKLHYHQRLDKLGSAIHYYKRAEMHNEARRCRDAHDALAQNRPSRISVASFGADGIIKIN